MFKFSYNSYFSFSLFPCHILLHLPPPVPRPPILPCFPILPHPPIIPLLCLHLCEGSQESGSSLQDLYEKKQQIALFPIWFQKSMIPRTIKKPDIQKLFDDNDPCLEPLQMSVDKDNYNVQTVTVETENRKLVLTVEFGRKLAHSLSMPLRILCLHLRIDFNEQHGTTSGNYR
jgi:hypothetical protein